MGAKKTYYFIDAIYVRNKKIEIDYKENKFRVFSHYELIQTFKDEYKAKFVIIPKPRYGIILKHKCLRFTVYFNHNKKPIDLLEFKNHNLLEKIIKKKIPKFKEVNIVETKFDKYLNSKQELWRDFLINMDMLN